MANPTLKTALACLALGILPACQPMTVQPIYTPVPAPVPVPARHPAYLRALAELREARAHLEHRGGDPRMKWDEQTVIREIDLAIREIKGAAIDDGKNLQDHPPLDARMDFGGRLRRTQELLHLAERDCREEEDNAFARGLQMRALQHIHEAIRFAEQPMALQPSLAPAPAPMPPAAVHHVPMAPAPVPVASAPRQHPAYLRALADLREARAHLERRGGEPKGKWDEQLAIRAIDQAIHEIKAAAIDDGKGLQDHAPLDARMDFGGRLHHTLELLHKAERDCREEEDNAFARGLQERALQHIHEAIRCTEAGAPRR